MISNYRNNQFKKVLNFNFVKKDKKNDLSLNSLKTFKLVCHYMKLYKTSDALEKIIGLARLCNKYIDQTEP